MEEKEIYISEGWPCGRELSITKFCDSIHFLEFQMVGVEGQRKQVTRPQPVY